MSNPPPFSPFQIDSPANKEQGQQQGMTQNSSAKKTDGFISSLGKIGLAVLGLVVLSGGLYLARPYLPEPLSNWMSIQLVQNPSRLFSPLGGLSQQQARQLYFQGLESLKTNQPQTALTQFSQLEKAYPGLQELILLHQAEAYGALGKERDTQMKLATLPQLFPQSPLRLKARYMMGQSYVRGNEPSAAIPIFKSLQQASPSHPYGIGSLYYLGLLTQKEDLQQSRQYWLSYLKACPDCRFSGDIAENLDKTWPTPDGEGHRWIGVGLANSDRLKERALTHLLKAPFASIWFELGNTHLKNQRPHLTLEAFSKGLIYSQSQEKSQKAIDYILKSPQGKDVLPGLKILATQGTLPNGDYLLWQLSQQSHETSQNYYRDILSHYPAGDYAPESSWQQLWPLIQSGQWQAYIENAPVHIERYAYARSTPKVRFWLAKAYEQSDINKAKTTYQQIVSQYPDNYYGFRSQARLKALSGGTDTGWQTTWGKATPYTPNFSLSGIRILPDLASFTNRYQAAQNNTSEAPRIYHALEELQQIGAANDIQLLSEESFIKTPADKIPVQIESWVALQNNQRPNGIRSIRDELQNRLKKDHGLKATNDELKMLYPVYFSQSIADHGQRQTVDPYIIQGLMREESYFNEFAVSSSNARGLMQLLPSTANDVASWEKIPVFSTLALFDPDTNIRLGTRYLKYLHEQFSSHPLNVISMASVGAYNGGPNAMKRWIAANPNFKKDPDLFIEQIPYEQTRDYIKKVFASAWNYRRLYAQ